MITRADVRLAVTVLVVALVGAACEPAASSSTVPGASSASASASPTATPSVPATTVPSAPAATSSASASPGAYDWSYEGATGPSHWAELSPAYYACEYGVQQSPIEISNPVEKRGPDPVFDYHAGDAMIVNDGHTIMAVPYGMNTIEVYHVSYVNTDRPTPTPVFDSPVSRLMQLQFRVPSEHTFGQGAWAPAEMQFVHQHPTGAFTIVGAMVVEGADDNARWAPYIDAMTTPQGTDGTVTIDWPNLLPSAPELVTYRYDGSLTTPPCTEHVQWILLAEPITLSAAQIDKMRAAYDGNARPIQPFGDYRSLTVDLKGD